MSKADRPQSREDLIRRYKSILQEVVDRRPSGIRLKIAEAIGRNKSFISQITSPNYPTPIPQRHLPLIFELSHFTPEEKAQFLNWYRRAHPRVGARSAEPASTQESRVLKLQLPRLESAQAEGRVDSLIRDFARRLNDMVRIR